LGTGILFVVPVRLIRFLPKAHPCGLRLCRSALRLRRTQFPPSLRLFGLLDHSGGRPLRKRESTVQSRGGPPFQNDNVGW